SGAKDVGLGNSHFADAAYVLPLLTLFVSCFAIGIKRLHDRNKPAWWILLFYVAPPAMQAFASLGELDSSAAVWLMLLSGAISIWAIIELGCLAGTRGPNRFGADPLAPDTARA